MSPKGPPFISFLFCKRMDVQKLPKAHLLHLLTGDQKKLKKNRIFFQFFPHAGTVEENT